MMLCFLQPLVYPAQIIQSSFNLPAHLAGLVGIGLAERFERVPAWQCYYPASHCSPNLSLNKKALLTNRVAVSLRTSTTLNTVYSPPRACCCVFRPKPSSCIHQANLATAATSYSPLAGFLLLRLCAYHRASLSALLQSRLPRAAFPTCSHHAPRFQARHKH